MSEKHGIVSIQLLDSTGLAFLFTAYCKWPKSITCSLDSLK